ncbi:MAG: acyl-CoA dehydrogenase family protein [Trueperaceae bacterium]|nr:acyl-CoA dehydrogenase family protein [Trueperaceae bacterium]
MSDTTEGTPGERLWFDLTDDQRGLLGTLRAFLRSEVAPGAAARDAAGEFPHDLVNELAKLGLFGLQVPERYGGSALNTVTSALIIEELAAADGSLCLTVASHNSLCVGHILVAGTDAQKAELLPALASGEKLGAWCLTEPASGSDAAGLTTTATETADGFRLNGSKMFITQGSVASSYVVMARTDAPTPGSSRSDGISAFFVDGRSPGLIRGRPEHKLGLKSSDTTPLTFEDVSVASGQLLGTRGQAFRDVMRVLDGGRIGIAAMGIGLGRAAVEIAGRYALERRQFGRPIAEQQAVSFKLAEAATELEAARLLMLKAAALRDAGRDFTTAAAMAKLKGSVAGVKACDDAIQILGGYGYMHDYEVERLWRDARLTRIGEGTDEIQHLIIGRKLLDALESGAGLWG